MKTKTLKRLLIITIILLGYVLGMIYGSLAHATEPGEGYGLEMQYLNTLYSVEESCATDNHKECNRYVAELTAIAYEMSEYRCGMYKDFRHNICWRNTMANLLN